MTRRELGNCSVRTHLGCRRLAYAEDLPLHAHGVGTWLTCRECITRLAEGAGVEPARVLPRRRSRTLGPPMPALPWWRRDSNPHWPRSERGSSAVGLVSRGSGEIRTPTARVLNPSPLPLGYRAGVERAGFEPAALVLPGLQPGPFVQLGHRSRAEGQGVEPCTVSPATVFETA